MKLFDLHCDTLTEMFESSQELADNKLHVSMKKAACYDPYMQIFAIWSNQNLSDDDNYINFFKIYRNTATQYKINDSFVPFLAVEGGKLLNNDLKRLDELYRTGVRFLTLVWKDVCCIGGAYNTGEGLTPFGTDVVKKCFDLNIVPDLSHASDKSFYETAELSSQYGKPVVATHSNSRTICNHKRNLSDDMFRCIVRSGGITGISLCRPHLTQNETCTIDTVISHIEHYLSLGGENTVCLGCDFDGIDSLPDGISDIGDLRRLADRLIQLNYSNSLTEDIFYNNAFRFMTDNHILSESL